MEILSVAAKAFTGGLANFVRVPHLPVTGYDPLSNVCKTSNGKAIRIAYKEVGYDLKLFAMFADSFEALIDGGNFVDVGGQIGSTEIGLDYYRASLSFIDGALYLTTISQMRAYPPAPWVLSLYVDSTGTGTNFTFRTNIIDAWSYDVYSQSLPVSPIFKASTGQLFIFTPEIKDVGTYYNDVAVRLRYSSDGGYTWASTGVFDSPLVDDLGLPINSELNTGKTIFELEEEHCLLCGAYSGFVKFDLQALSATPEVMIGDSNHIRRSLVKSGADYFMSYIRGRAWESDVCSIFQYVGPFPASSETLILPTNWKWLTDIQNGDYTAQTFDGLVVFSAHVSYIYSGSKSVGAGKRTVHWKSKKENGEWARARSVMHKKADGSWERVNT